MADFKCNSCGDELEFKTGDKIGICPSCGRKQPLPRDNSEEINRLLEEARRLRHVEKDYDRARYKYEEVLNIAPDEPLANWGMVLCHYGIQYADDPITHRKVPTLNRMQVASILDNGYYKKACEMSEYEQRVLYEEDAKYIDGVQREFHAIASKEKPYDVFISYKDKVDGTDTKTEDFEIARQLYEGLFDKGLRVFFSDRTLKDKVGKFEPYIYAALESAPVMIVVGTKKEYFNAEWVRNEWTRYIDRIRNGEKKFIVPVFRDMDIRDIPVELSAQNQAYDASKFMDISRLMDKVREICEERKKAAAPAAAAPAGAGSDRDVWKKNMFTALENENWRDAAKFAEWILSVEPTYAEAYLAYILIDRRLTRRELLSKQTERFTGDNNYRLLKELASPALMAEMREYEDKIEKNIEQQRREVIYADAIRLLNNANDKRSAEMAAAQFERVRDYQDAADKIAYCMEYGEQLQQDIDRQKAILNAQTSKGMQDKISGIIGSFGGGK
ncbi:MAG: toll/interleukin-1 receptor domain-containing protein [Lachnospiraceae bacterium]|nr:toll/interleukin-1 receptor domain-containing protein [Lachnospiraceae bacterium]